MVANCDIEARSRWPPHLPCAFTEHGAIQAANVLNSPRAVEMSIYVVRAFVQLRELLSSNKELAKRLDQLEARIEKKLATHDEAIAAMLSAIRNSCIRQCRSAGLSASPLISPRSRSDSAKLHGPTWIRLLALAYPAITKSRSKNASNPIYAAGFWSKVRQPNFSSSHKM